MKDWQKTLISPAMSLRDAIQKLNATAAQIILVTGDDHVLLGTITDGDIRRGILGGARLEDSVDRVMNRSPGTTTLDEPRERRLETMRLRHFRHLPIVDENRRVIGVESLDQFATSQRSNPVVIMAGGVGKRLKPLTDDRPKPMLTVGDKPLLEINLENFLKHGFKNFNISVNYKADLIEEHFGDGSRWKANINYLRENEPLGTAGALSLLSDVFNEPMIVINGDVLTKVNIAQMLDFHREQRSQLTMGVREYDLEVPFGVVRIENSHVSSIDEKPMQKFFVNAGIYILEPAILSLIPKGQYFDMPSLIDKLLAQGHRPAAFPLREYWLDVGRLSDFERANNEYEGHVE